MSQAALDLIRSSGDPKPSRVAKKEEQARGLFQKAPVKSAYQVDFIFADRALYKHVNSGQGIYIDPGRDFIAVYLSATPYVPHYGKIKLLAYMCAAAKMRGE